MSVTGSLTGIHGVIIEKFEHFYLIEMVSEALIVRASCRWSSEPYSVTVTAGVPCLLFYPFRGSS